jgi:hypothetical protein
MGLSHQHLCKLSSNSRKSQIEPQMSAEDTLQDQSRSYVH